ncbi:unnamed protein product [Pleuronectes platessa]|uniref:Uncharacterized protein n=1 Tax=Pleuronectes platessa TaxID=8262 RepID=A0A9N7Y502_PLEPL|nr:unnamed protein product [Pleuronectes platessa]
MPDLLRTYKIIVPQPRLSHRRLQTEESPNFGLHEASPVMTSKEVDDDMWSFAVTVLVTHSSDTKYDFYTPPHSETQKKQPECHFHGNPGCNQRGVSTAVSQSHSDSQMTRDLESETGGEPV